MGEAREEKTSFAVQPAGAKLGLLYALFPLGLGAGELLWRREGAATAMQWLAASAGVVFASVLLAYSQGFAAGRAAGEPSSQPHFTTLEGGSS